MNITLRHGDCFEVLKELESGSVGSVICDPPYGLEFMGKDFDTLGDGKQQRVWHSGWVAEAYRVLKPGGVLKAFSGTRTYHHMAMAMGEVGFDIGLEAWCYGSGFPKSRNISKDMDRMAGVEREVIGHSRGVGVEDNQGYGGIARGGVGIVQKGIDIPVTAPATDEAKAYNNWGTGLKPAWEPIVVGRKPTL